MTRTGADRRSGQVPGSETGTSFKAVKPSFATRMEQALKGALLLGSTVLMLPLTLSAQPVLAPEVASVGPPSDVPVAVQNLRWRMLDRDVSTLTFRNMNTLFTTRSVPRSGSVSILPRTDQALDFSYEVEGQTYEAEAFAERSFSHALLIIKKGMVVHERYLNNSDASDRFIGWSMTKSLVSLLIGKALEEGRIRSLDDDIVSYLPELSEGAYRDVSIRQVLQMRSGVDYEERYDFANPGTAATNHITSLVKNVSRFADMAQHIPGKHPPGEVFEYKTLDTAVLGLLLERVHEGKSLASTMAQQLWEPLGAEADAYFIMDGEPGVGREFSGAGLSATLRDFARIGLMMLNEGEFNGRQIIPRDWIQDSVRPAGDESGFLDYGYQWWTFSGTRAYAAIGLQGQYIYVDPETDTMVVKLSHYPPEDEGRISAEAFTFFRAASAWTPSER